MMNNRYFLTSIAIRIQNFFLRIPSGTIVLLVLIPLLSIWQQRVHADEKWFVSAYFGQASDSRFLDIILKFDHRPINSRMAAFTVGRELTTYRDTLRLEAEGQVAKHWGVQTHAELNGALVLRWLPFFWDDYLDTSFGIGEGLSYASDIPVLETDEDEETSRILNYLMVEFSFEIPKKDSWDLFVRLHHRSGIYGLINGVNEGSNILCAGIRYRL